MTPHPQQIRRCKSCRRVGCVAGIYQCCSPGESEPVDLDYLRERHRLGVLEEHPDTVSFVVEMEDSQ